MNSDDIIYFEINDWWPDETYPNEEPFVSWINETITTIFSSDKWAKKNKLCIIVSLYDQALAFCISAKREWVEKRCPCILKYNKFLRVPDENGVVHAKYNGYFLEYKEENFGSKFIKSSQPKQSLI